jgi:hypothetical protein
MLDRGARHSFSMVGSSRIRINIKAYDIVEPVSSIASAIASNAVLLRKLKKHILYSCTIAQCYDYIIKEYMKGL